MSLFSNRRRLFTGLIAGLLLLSVLLPQFASAENDFGQDIASAEIQYDGSLNVVIAYNSRTSESRLRIYELPGLPQGEEIILSQLKLLHWQLLPGISFNTRSVKVPGPFRRDRTYLLLPGYIHLHPWCLKPGEFGPELVRLDQAVLEESLRPDVTGGDPEYKRELEFSGVLKAPDLVSAGLNGPSLNLKIFVGKLQEDLPRAYELFELPRDMDLAGRQLADALLKGELRLVGMGETHLEQHDVREFWKLSLYGVSMHSDVDYLLVLDGSRSLVASDVKPVALRRFRFSDKGQMVEVTLSGIERIDTSD
ncbi:hypothetical protein KDL44_00260 [bacterium]|nr:hypothetical protein [bacterium]